MGQYIRGDVLLASVALDDRSPPKVRPVIVVRGGESGRIFICPVSSRPPFDAPAIPLAINDFAAGGLDLFGESFVMISRVITLRSGDVIGKKGRLTDSALEEIASRVPAQHDGVTRPGPGKHGRRYR